jgi:hypothetical protein
VSAKVALLYLEKLQHFRGFSPNLDFRGFSLYIINLAGRQFHIVTWDGRRARGGGAQRPVLHVTEPKQTGRVHGRVERPKLTSTTVYDKY